MPNPSRLKAVTLIEITVCVVIIVILVAVLLPALMRAREAARQTECSNNLVQRFKATDGRTDAFAESLYGVRLSTLPQRQQPLAGLGVEGLSRCPSDENDRREFSYIMNMEHQVRASPRSKEWLFKVPDKNVNSSFALCFEYGGTQENPHALSYNLDWFSNEHVKKKTVWSAVSSELAVGRHNGSSNFLFADGHVESIAEETVKQWCDSAVNFGFAIPTR